MYTADIHKLPRHFVPANFIVTNWESLEPYFKDLSAREITTKAELEKWLKDLSELEAVVNEDACWRQIKMTCDTENKTLEEAFNFFCMEIQPKIEPYTDALNKKLVNHPLLNELDKEKYFTYLRSMRKSIELFREENIPIQADLSVLQQQYGMVIGKMSVTIKDKEYTLQQANKFLQNEDRDLREEVYRKVNERRLEDKETLDNLYNQLVQKRNQQALNAGFANYRDYRFKELGRFDYTKEDC